MVANDLDGKKLNQQTHKTTPSIHAFSMRFHPIVFTGKERDEETGYGYFGARYMDHELMTSFFSVDRYADKYPSISPYAYCAWNPIKLIDPSGDTIKNYYEQYPQSDFFHRTQSLIDDFRVSHPDEFNYLDNLSFTDKDGNTTPINIVIELSDKNGPQNPDFGNRREGVTKYNYNRMTIDQVDENNNTIETRVVIVGLIDNRISITLYKHHHDIETLANEFGDAIFAVKRPETVDMQKGWKYGQKATTKYSFDYEKYIIGESKERPDPMNKETYKDTLK